jgi:N-carbamoyl-L-amino-acid hydrolase
MGSEAFVGWRTLDEIKKARDADGIDVGTALESCRAAGPLVPDRALGGPVAGYIEAHIEQGPILEAQSKPVGIVTGIQGKLTFKVTVSGEEAHAGTTPRRDRRDALLAAAAMVRALEEATADPSDVVRFTVGALTVRPNAPSVVPSEVAFSIDLRHPDPATLGRLGDAIPVVCAQHAGPCSVAVQPLVRAMSLTFPDAMQSIIRKAARDIGLPSLDLFSSAGHDARQMHAVCPSGMIFVPCRRGVSHHISEWAEPDHLASGARVLAEALLALTETSTTD